MSATTGGPFKSQGSTLALSNENAANTAVGTATFVTVGEVTSIGEPSGEANDIDVTNLSSTAREFLIGLPDEGTIAIGLNALQGDPGQMLLDTAKGDQNPRWVHITWSNGAVWTIKALVKKYTWAADIDQQIKASTSLRLSGGWTKA